MFIFEDAAEMFDRKTIDRIVGEQQRELERRIEVLRQGRSLPEIENRTVILVDDGIAMGSTMRASITLCKNRNAARIIVACPVARAGTARQIAALVDQAVILETPSYFRAVAQVYGNWYDVGDDEVIEIRRRWG